MDLSKSWFSAQTLRGEADCLAFRVSRKASLWHTVSAFMRVRSCLFVPVKGSAFDLKTVVVLFAPVNVEVVPA